MFKQFLADKFIKSIQPAGTGKRTIYWDTGEPHLGLRVTDQGAKSFVVVGRIGKKPAIYTHVIGKYPATSLAVARQQSQIIWPMMEAGRNPREEAKRAEADAFEKAVEIFLEQNTSVSEKTRRHTKSVMHRIWIPAFHGRALLSIERTDIIRRLDKLKGMKSAWTGKVSNFPVRHARSVISNFFNWCAAGERFGLKHSPAVRLSDKVLKLNGGPRLGMYLMKPGADTTRIGVLDLDDHEGNYPWVKMCDAAKKAIHWARTVTGQHHPDTGRHHTDDYEAAGRHTPA